MKFKPKMCPFFNCHPAYLISYRAKIEEQQFSFRLFSISPSRLWKTCKTGKALPNQVICCKRQSQNTGLILKGKILLVILTFLYVVKINVDTSLGNEVGKKKLGAEKSSWQLSYRSAGITDKTRKVPNNLK